MMTVVAGSCLWVGADEGSPRVGLVWVRCWLVCCRGGFWRGIGLWVVKWLIDW